MYKKKYDSEPKNAGARQSISPSAGDLPQNVNQMPDDEAEIVRQLTQKQYEISNELSGGIEKLKKLIQETEQYVCKAKGKYQD